MIEYGDLSEVINQINANTTLLKIPAMLAFDKDPSDEYQRETPACLVHPNQMFANGASDSPVCRQEVSASFTCLIVAPVDKVAAVIKEVRLSLVGWQPTPQHSRVRLMTRNMAFGEPLDIRGGYVWWSETFEADILLRIT